MDAHDIPYWQLPNAGDLSDEDAYNDETDRYVRHRIKVNCPQCGRLNSPLCSPSTIRQAGGWRWVGLDHREPYVEYRTRCGSGCGAEYRFTTYTPQ